MKLCPPFKVETILLEAIKQINKKISAFILNELKFSYVFICRSIIKDTKK